MSGTWRGVLAAALAAAVLASPVPASQTTAAEGASEVTMTVPAVARGEGGVETGVTSTLAVRVESPGAGRVYFSADPLTELDTQGAARIAALVAAETLGVNPEAYDYYVRLESDSLVVGGPSAGAAMAVAIACAILGVRTNSSVVMTGMVNPDGTVGPVGGIPEKLRAAAEAGAKLFLVPAGQLVVTEREVVEERGPFWVTRRVVPRRVDLRELGRELGVRVEEVLTVRDALEAFTGRPFGVSPGGEPSFSAGVREEMAGWVADYESAYENLSVEVGGLIRSAPTEAADLASMLMSRAGAAASRARDLESMGRPYAAASAAFQAALEADQARAVLEMAAAGDPSSYLLGYASEVNSTLSALEADLDSASPSSWAGSEALVAARVRYYDAVSAVEEAEDLYSSGRLLDSLMRLVYARWRADTCRRWLGLTSVGGAPARPDLLRRAAGTFTYAAESAVGYVETLAQEVGSSPDLLGAASDYLERAKGALSSGDPYGALGLSAEALAYSSSAVHSMFPSNLTEVVGEVRAEASAAASSAAAEGAEPLLAISYLELSESVEDGPSALLFAELAAAHARLTAAAASLGSPPNPNPNPTPNPQPGPGPGPNPRPSPPSGGGRAAAPAAGIPWQPAVLGAAAGAAAGSVATYLLARRREHEDNAPVRQDQAVGDHA